MHVHRYLHYQPCLSELHKYTFVTFSKQHLIQDLSCQSNNYSGHPLCIHSGWPANQTTAVATLSVYSRWVACCMFPPHYFTLKLGYYLTLYGHIKTAEHRNIIEQYGDWYTGHWWVGCYIWYSKDGPGRADGSPGPSTLYQMSQPTHQQQVYQLHIIRCGTIIACGLWRVNSRTTDNVIRDWQQWVSSAAPRHRHVGLSARLSAQHTTINTHRDGTAHDHQYTPW